MKSGFCSCCTISVEDCSEIGCVRSHQLVTGTDVGGCLDCRGILIAEGGYAQKKCSAYNSHETYSTSVL
eukprot:XP_001704816.1 Hypothetical protein GL50803_92018 [Giardia lamblia ATCC 50803]